MRWLPTIQNRIDDIRCQQRPVDGGHGPRQCDVGPRHLAFGSHRNLQIMVNATGENVTAVYDPLEAVTRCGLNQLIHLESPDPVC